MSDSAVQTSRPESADLTPVSPRAAGAMLVGLATYAVIFPGGDRPGGRRSHAVPLLVYGSLHLTMVCGLIAMSWYDPGLTAAIVIGTLAMGPIFVLGLVGLLRETPARIRGGNRA